MKTKQSLLKVNDSKLKKYKTSHNEIIQPGNNLVQIVIMKRQTYDG